MPAASADFLIPPSSVRRSCVLKRAPDGDFVLHMKNSDCALSFEATIPRFSGACNLLRAHTVGDLDVQVHAAPSILDCVRLDFGNHSCLPSRCEHVRLACEACFGSRLEASFSPVYWLDRVRVAYTASAPRRRVSWIAHGWVSTVRFRATVHLAGLFSVPDAAHLTHPIRGGDCCRSAIHTSRLISTDLPSMPSPALVRDNG